jgi:phospholipase/carboxylesterase
MMKVDEGLMGVATFEHVWEPAADSAAPTLLLLHGTGGNEKDLLPLGRMLAPGAALLSPRGRVLEQGMPRFFRRLAEGVFDLEDLVKRTAELAEFVHVASHTYQFDLRHVVAVGFSNGANIAASTLLLHPQVLGGAVLFRAMVPIVPDPLPALPATPVLLSNGRRDPLVSTEETERLADLLRRAGAALSLEWQSAGHELTHADLTRAQTWLSAMRRILP